MALRITFVFPHLAVTGGNKVALMYAEGLAAKGHDVTVLHGPPPTMKLRFAGPFFQRPHPVIEPHPNVRNLYVDAPIADLGRFLPDADAVVATWWATVEAVAEAPESKGRKFHFVQGHEVFSYVPARSADVYRLPFHKIAVSRWLVDLMRDTYGASDVSLVLNPVDVQRFSWRERSRGAVPTVGTVYSHTPVKNSAMAIEAFMLARAEIPDLRLACFGHEIPPKELVDRDFVDFHFRPAQDAIPELYRSCDCWLFTSIEEGFGLPILEAMAVGTPVIATPAGAAPDLVTSQTGAIVGLDPAQMAAEIVQLLSKPHSEWEGMSRDCRSMAERHDEQTALSEFEAVLVSKTSRP